MTNVYSNIVTISESGTSGGGGLGLAISNYSVTYSCSLGIVVSGVVIYNNNPVPNVMVEVGFCSQFDFSKNQFTGNYDAVGTASDGSFTDYIYTATPPGGSNCIVAMVQYNNQTAVAQNSVTIPNCGGGGGGSTYPACPEWYIENPDGTYMGIDMNSGTYSLSTSYTYLNNVQVYHQGSFYATAPLFKCSDGSWWVHFTPLNSVIVMYYHIIPGQCTP